MSSDSFKTLKDIPFTVIYDEEKHQINTFDGGTSKTMINYSFLKTNLSIHSLTGAALL